MRICCWNTRRATCDSAAKWEYLREIRPDVALLQEVSSIPTTIEEEYSAQLLPARAKTGRDQAFGTAVLVRGNILNSIELFTQWDWVNHQLQLFRGNLVALRVACESGETLNVVSIYIPAWPISQEQLHGADISSVKSKYAEEVWVSDLLAAALHNQAIAEEDWIVAGDLNSSITFMWLYWNSKNTHK